MRRRDFLAAAALTLFLGKHCQTAATTTTLPNISIVSDELDTEPVKAFALGEELGFSQYSIRMLGSERVPYVPEEQLRIVDDILQKGKGTVLSISPGTNKVLFVEEEVDKMVQVDLAKAIELAHRWNCHTINLFSWLKTENPVPPTEEHISPSMPAGVVSSFQKMAALAEAEDVLLCIENGYQTWADTGLAAKELIERVGNDSIQMLWDPSNAMRAYARWGLAANAPERIDPTAYLLRELETISALIADVHIRDGNFKANEFEWAAAGTGVIGWEQILDALIKNGYNGPLTIEHHLENKSQAARHALAYLTDNWSEQR